MTIQRHFTSKHILETILGVIVFGIIAIRLLTPPAMGAASGEDYIVIACLLAIGSGFLWYGLFNKQ
jgi:hypothetical protein